MKPPALGIPHSAHKSRDKAVHSPPPCGVPKNGRAQTNGPVLSAAMSSLGMLLGPSKCGTKLRRPESLLADELEPKVLSAPKQPRSIHVSLIDLPPEVLDAIVAELPPSGRGFIRHVSRELRVAVSRFDADKGQVAARRLCPRDLCCSMQLIDWAVAQGCPWSVEKNLIVAAGRLQGLTPN